MNKIILSIPYKRQAIKKDDQKFMHIDEIMQVFFQNSNDIQK